MSDDFRIPMPATGFPGGGRAPISSSYRARQARPGLALPYAKIGAAAGGVLLLAALGGWAVTHRHPAAVPVIEADARPLRVKPDNPGGLQVAGADELDEGAGTERMAPPAEAPAPQALRAQIQPPPPAAAPAPAVPVPAVVPSVASPLPDTPLPVTPPGKPGRGARPLAAPGVAPAPAAAAVPPPPALAPARAGATLVQLGALGSEAAAQAEWQRLSHSAPDLVAGRQPSIQKTEHDGKPLWRLRTGGFADVADATGFCAKLRAKGGVCTIASF